MKIVCYSCSQKLDLTELEPFTKIDCPVCESKIIVPKQFGNILLEEDLGTGRLARVYRAMDITLDREVAVKVLKDDILDTKCWPCSVITGTPAHSALLVVAPPL